MNWNPLLYRRQFILSKRLLSFDGWQNTSLGFNFVLSYHPDLWVTQSTINNSTLTLLGYMLDSEHPLWSNEEIIKDLHCNIKTFSDLEDLTSRMGGRWVLIYLSISLKVILHDAIGLRDVYYYLHQDEVICASQPHIIAKKLNIEPSFEKEITSFFSEENICRLGLMWSGNRTPYDGIFHLLPNHYLDLAKGKTYRYGIKLSPNTLPVDIAVKENSRILTNIIYAVHHRFKPIVACTSGFDSRVILAASKKVAPFLDFYICQYGHIKDTHPDIVIPQKMFSELNVSFKVEKPITDIDPIFEQTISENTFLYRPKTAPLTYMLYKKYSDRISVSENSLPMLKVFFRRIYKPTGYILARMVHQHNFSFIIECLDKWLIDAKSYIDDPRLNISDHYFWEFLLGNWASTAATVQDIAIEECSPSNCRQFFLNFFSIDPKYHTQQHTYDLHYKMISYMWKELLKYPINPTRKGWMFRTLRKYGLFHEVQYIKNRILNR